MPSSKQKPLGAYPTGYYMALREVVQIAARELARPVEVVHERAFCSPSAHQTKRRKLGVFANQCRKAKEMLPPSVVELQQIMEMRHLELKVVSTYNQETGESRLYLMLDFTRKAKEQQLRGLL